ncbi:hypothetical protein UA75_22245 [Actinoalloteichus sp. GBA129-24]|uniref:Uncharacterized protein n=1 Tax=Actinoalloteichus fjordicus TaxID=1612552 RepID=A0AAC9LEX6_9PSEU|nr:hypothetical protein UA74_21775 [Actinoalloteichus fjordicus]APU22435.1 hypothetical protein UA75_22245 [Actinoalloteichus sp. GBA129-24]
MIAAVAVESSRSVPTRRCGIDEPMIPVRADAAPNPPASPEIVLGVAVRPPGSRRVGFS